MPTDAHCVRSASHVAYHTVHKGFFGFSVLVLVLCNYYQMTIDLIYVNSGLLYY